MISKKIESFKVNNRKYLGSKTKILDFIYETIEKETKGNYDTLIDLFAGTGVVSNFFIEKNKKVIVNDFLDSNYIIYKSFFSKKNINEDNLKNAFNLLQKINYKKNNYFSCFGNKYFTINDANKIGSIREEIENLYRNLKINDDERNVLISSLIYSADKVANSMGHYEIYIERSIEDKFIYKLIDYKNNKFAEKIYNEDSNNLIKKISADVLYLDPPYNSRQYSNLYHLLDTLSNWDNPSLTGKALKPKEKKISQFSLKDARDAMLDLVLNADVKYIFISYNNTHNYGNARTSAKISNEEMFEILSLRGDVKKVEKSFSPYNTGNSNLKNYKEVLYICKVKKPVIKNMKVKYPFNYMGGKFKLIDNINEIFNNGKIQSHKKFIDVFSGGGNIGVNSGYDEVYCFDSNKELINILNTIKKEKTFDFLDKIYRVINKYKLSNTIKHGYEYYNGNSNNGLKFYNNEKYLSLRNDYNKNNNIILLIVLVIYSFNNSMNFNLSGEFNIPCGKRDFNRTMRKNYILFSQKIKNLKIEFIHSDFRYINSLISPKKNITYYFDPPYIAGFAHYNKLWTTKEESDLLNLIKKITNLNCNWVLSNSLKIGNNENKLLIDFIEKNKFSLINLDLSYDNSWFLKKKKGNKEILLTNIFN